jgi:two-component system, chemotaxis family, protein-glutamate methylesterase/glutaminase
MNGVDVVVIGASWGGLRALSLILPALPADFPAPIVVAQHRDADSEDELLSRLLTRDSALRVIDADDKAPLQAGTVLLAPPGYHLLLADECVELSVDAPVQFSRPSIDVLFESAAEAFGSGVVGVLLTGANADGAAGLRRIVDRGGYAMVQDPATAEVRAMPTFAIRAVPEACVLPLEQIGPHLAAVRGRRLPPCQAVLG